MSPTNEHVFIFSKNILSIDLSHYPSDGQTIIMKNILMMDCSVSYQHKCFYFAKYSIYGFTFVVSNGLTIILSPYLYYANTYVCIFNILTSHFNNQTRFLTYMDFEETVTSNNQGYRVFTKTCKKKIYY